MQRSKKMMKGGGGGSGTAADEVRKNGPHPGSLAYRPGQLSAPYNINRVMAIRAKQASVQGIMNLNRAMGEMVAKEKYDQKRDKIMTSGALNMIGTNNTPSGLGLPADKYPAHAAPKYSGTYDRRAVNRRTHKRNYKFDEPSELYGAPPAVNDGGRTLPEITTLRNDAIKKGGRSNKAAGDKFLMDAYKMTAQASNLSRSGMNPFAGKGIKRQDSSSSFSTDGEDYGIEENNPYF